MKISINMKKAGWAFVFLLLLKPDFLEYLNMNIVDYIVDYSRVLIAIIVLIKFLLKKDKEIFILISALFQIAVVFSTFVNKADNSTAIVYAAVYFIVIVIGSWIVGDASILCGLYNALNIYIFCNLITIIFYPQGWYTSGSMQWCWVIGYKTNFLLYIIPFICIAWLYYEKTGRKRYLLAIFTAGIQVFLVKTAGGIIAVTVIFLGIILSKIKRESFYRIFSLGKVIAAYLLANILLLFFKVYLYFGEFFYNILGKEKTLSTRQFIWNAFIPAVKEKIILGHGNEIDAYTISKLHSAPYAHNLLLNLAYSAGMVGVSCFIFFLVWLAYKKKTDIGKQYYYICTVCIASFLLGSLTETWKMMEAIPILFVLFYWGNKIFEGELTK